MSIEFAKWEEDSFGVFNLHIDGVHAFIQKRPSYCDRGHYSFNVDGIPDIDAADRFPRYYMSFHAALREATAWLDWRLYKVPFMSSEAIITLTMFDFTVLEIS